MKSTFDVRQHILVFEHSKLNESEKKKLLEAHNIQVSELPKIAIKDPAIQHLTPKIGDVIKISRPSPTAGKATYYRGVINVG